MKTLSRRTVLRGAIAGGSVAIGLPFLEAMMPRAANLPTSVFTSRDLIVISAPRRLGLSGVTTLKPSRIAPAIR